MNRTGSAFPSPGLRHRPRRRSSPVGVGRRSVLGRSGFPEPADRPSEQLQLVDGLIGAGLPQFGGPVGGQEDEGNPGGVGFHHSRKQVGDRGAGGGDHRRRMPTDPGDSQRKEARRTLIDEDRHLGPGMVLCSSGQCGGARSGGNGEAGYPSSDQFVHHYGSQSNRRVRTRNIHDYLFYGQAKQGTSVKAKVMEPLYCIICDVG